MATTFHRPVNLVPPDPIASPIRVAAPRAAGAPISVTTGMGALFGSSYPLIVTAIRGRAVLCILEVTGRSTDTLTISGAIEGTTDVNLVPGDTLEMRPTALAITEIQAAVNALEGRTFNLKDKAFGAVGDGVTNDAAALVAALNACKAMTVTGTPAILDIPMGVYRITFSKTGTLTNPRDQSYPPQWSFYNFDATTWGPCAPVGGGTQDGQSPNIRPLVIRGNGSIILVDGSVGSYLFSSSGGPFRIDFENITFRAYDPTKVIHGLAFQYLTYASWNRVYFEDFCYGIGLFLSAASERNSLRKVVFNNCQTGMTDGTNQVIDWEMGSTCNENSYEDVDFIKCGRTLTEAQCLTNGFLEINNSQLPRFRGGSWKLNKNAAIIRQCVVGEFDGIYFEVNGYTYLEGQAGVPNSQPGYTNHLILDARSDLTTGVVTGYPIRNITFKNCTFSDFSGITFRASAAHQIAGITFDNCGMGLAQCGLMFVTGEEQYIHDIEIRGTVFDNWSGVATTTDEYFVRQRAVDPTTGIVGSPTLVNLDVTYRRPHGVENLSGWGTYGTTKGGTFATTGSSAGYLITSRTNPFGATFQIYSAAGNFQLYNYFLNVDALTVSAGDNSVFFAGVIHGDGSGLTNLNPAHLAGTPATVVGAKAGNTALASLVSALAGLGLIRDSTS